MLAFRNHPIRFLSQLAVQHGDIAEFRLGPINAVLLNHPDLIEEVLIKQKSRFPKLGRQAKTIRLIDGNSLFVKEGKDWVDDRRLIQSAFHPRRMPAYAEMVVAQTLKMMESWGELATLNFCDVTTDLSIMIAGQTMLGTDLKPEVLRLRKMAKDRSDVFVSEMGASFRLPDHWPLPSKKKKRSVIQTMDQLIYRIMDDKRLANKSANESGSESANGFVDDNLLSILMTASRDSQMPDQQIRDHANMLFQAGVDDIATAMVWMFYLIARHPEVQSKMLAEIIAEEAIDQTDSEPKNENGLSRSSTSERLPSLKRLPYFERVVNESLRLYPSTWMFTARKAIKESVVCGYPIKHRTWIFISPLITQRDQRFFPTPTQFDPDRFSRERFTDLQKRAFFPFGVGPRACAGTKFSMMELVLVAATILKRYEVNFCDDQDEIKPIPKVTVRPARPVMLRIKRRS